MRLLELLKKLSCVIHRQHLAVKILSVKLSETLKVAILCVNKIKAHALNSKLLKQLCVENDEDFTKLLRCNEVRWLSRGNFLKRLLLVFDSVGIYPVNKSYIAYISDLFHEFN